MDDEEYSLVLRRKKTFVNGRNFWTTYLVLSCLLITLPPNRVVAQTAQQVAKKGLASTVLLVMQDDSGQPVSLGSGFFVGDGEIASNFHVVRGASQGYAKVFNDKTKYNILGITGMDVGHDLVLLKMAGKTLVFDVKVLDIQQRK
jgi:S1-C subfamily serine protease